MDADTYTSPLATRNASPAMLKLFSPRYKITLWRKLWIALAEEERNLGIERISRDALQQMNAAVDDIDFALAAEYEARLRHDVMAHIHTFEHAAPAAKGVIHLGATSQFVNDNSDLCIYRDALQLVAARLAQAIDGLSRFAEQWKDLPTLGYTHFQPAQLTTVGKRAATWAYDFALTLEQIEHRLATLRFRGVKGTTGTQASFLELFENDAAKVDALDDAVTRRFGFDKSFVVTGQTNPRLVEAMIGNDLAAAAAAVHKFANDVRLLAGLKQMEEPFEKNQVGSSAMAYKRNPMRCERATGLARFVISLASSPLQTAAEQWLERTLDDSSNKRLSLPEMFLALDGALGIVANVAGGLVVYEATIAKAVAAELPFMATEAILMAGVRAGGDRQELHEAIRIHSQAAAARVKGEGLDNDLLARLRADPQFARTDLDDVMDASRYVGLASRQVDRFLAEVAGPVRSRYAQALGETMTLRV